MTQPVAHSPLLDQALAVYLEPHAEGRRVLLLGEAEGTLAQRLSHVAERLEIIDPEHRVPADVGVPELPFRDASFDLVLVVDVTLLPEPWPDAVAELRRVTRDDGILLLGLVPGEDKRRRRGAPEEALQRLLAAEFRHTHVIEQGPVAGYSFSVNDGRRPEEFSIDSSLMGGAHRQPLRYLALGSDVRVTLETRLWVQVPEREGEGGKAAPSQALVAELRRAEEAARDALRREAEVLRELEAERKAHAIAERSNERVKHLERKLIELEADYDDAVGRMRFLENELSERDNVRERERAEREKVERELNQQKKQMAAIEAGREEAKKAAASVHAELSALQEERASLEQRLKQAGGQILALGRDVKHHETLARDLLEELRSREVEGKRSVEHDAQVAELEAERARAVERAMQAEVAREAATMRADELRAQIHALVAAQAAAEKAAAEAAVQEAPKPELEPIPVVQPELVLDAAGERAQRAAEDAARGEIRGLRLRLEEAEAALSVQQVRAEEAVRGLPEASSEADVEVWAERLDRAHDRIDELEEALRRAERRAEDAGRTVELEAELDRMDHKLRELTRDLEEADRLAEAHAEDAERLETIEGELEVARRRMDALEDELRGTQDELRTARAQAEVLAGETKGRIEQAERAAAEARAERDDARVALAEARAILAQLAGGDAAAAPSAGEAQVASASVESELRAELEARDARLAEVERELNERNQRILQLEENLRAQIRGSVPPPPFGSSDA